MQGLRSVDWLDFNAARLDPLGKTDSSIPIGDMRLRSLVVAMLRVYELVAVKFRYFGVPPQLECLGQESRNLIMPLPIYTSQYRSILSVILILCSSSSNGCDSRALNQSKSIASP